MEAIGLWEQERQGKQPQDVSVFREWGWTSESTQTKPTADGGLRAKEKKGYLVQKDEGRADLWGSAEGICFWA